MKRVQMTFCLFFLMTLNITASAATSEEFKNELNINRSKIFSGIHDMTVHRSDEGSLLDRLNNFSKAFNLNLSDASFVQKKDGKHLVSKDNGWRISLNQTGTSGFYHNEEVENTRALISIDDIEPSGRLIQRFSPLVKEKLNQLFRLEKDEELVTVQIRADIYSSTHSGKRIGGYSLTYYRKKAGTFIIGGGSYLKVGLTVDGEIVSVRFDWPKYTFESTREKTVGLDEIGNRTQLMKEKLGIKTAKPMEIKICGLWDDPKTKEPQIGLECIYGNDDVLLKVPAGEVFDMENIDSKRILYKSDKLQDVVHE